MEQFYAVQSLATTRHFDPAPFKCVRGAHLTPLDPIPRLYELAADAGATQGMEKNGRVESTGPTLGSS